MTSSRRQAKVLALHKIEFLYYKRSQGTLIHQGGPMTQQEAEDFENLSNFSAILEMRTWDEKAKDVTMEVINNDKFKNLIRNVLEERVQ